MVTKFEVGKCYRSRNQLMHTARIFSVCSDMNVIKGGNWFKVLYCCERRPNHWTIQFEGVTGGRWSYWAEDFVALEEEVNFKGEVYC